MNNKAIRDLFDAVYVVSLPESKDRRRHICEHLPSVGVRTFSFFDGTPADDPSVARAQARGKVLAYPPCFRCGGLDCGNPHCNNFLLPSQIACYLTYRRLWRHIVDRPEQRVLIVEDDVFIHPYARKVFKWTAEKIGDGSIPFTPDKACLLRMGWAYGEDHRFDKLQCRVAPVLKMSNPCHAMTRRFAAALIKRDRMVRCTVDNFIHEIAPRPGEAYSILPPVASELSWTHGQFASTIHPKQVRVDYLRAEGDEVAAVAEAERVAGHVKKKYFRPLLISGHPRGGTGYAASLCRQLGVDVGHERLGEHGISSWMFAVDSVANPYAQDAAARTRRALAWRWLIMPVRDPATAAGSIMRDSRYAPPSYDFRREHIRRALGVDLDDFPTPLERALRSLTGWARILIEQSPDLVFRVEDQQESLRSFLRQQNLIGDDALAIKLDTRQVNANKPYKGVRYRKPPVTRKALLSLADETKREISWYCDFFGYPEPWPLAN